MQPADHFSLIVFRKQDVTVSVLEFYRELWLKNANLFNLRVVSKI